MSHVFRSREGQGPRLVRTAALASGLGMLLGFCGCASSRGAGGAPPVLADATRGGGARPEGDRAAGVSKRVDAGPADAVVAGTPFTVRLNDSLGTAVSQPGDDFSAVVLTPLYTKDGRLVVPRGALLFGRVSDVHHPPHSGLCLQILTVETTWLPASVQATVRRAGGGASVDSVETYQPELGYDAVVRPPAEDRGDGPFSGMVSGVGGGPLAAPADRIRADSADRLFLPEGTELQLELARPLLAAARR